MPRQARLRSNTGIYHVMLRGNERKSVFIDDEDKQKFIDILFAKRDACAFLLYAYCIMDNHAHLVLREGNEDISSVMKKLGISYVHYFNNKYKRVGHVFQDRYKSETIENDKYLLAVIRYVHKNPEQAGVAKMNDYPWSSWNRYVDPRYQSSVPEIRDVLQILSTDSDQGRTQFVLLHHGNDSVECGVEMEAAGAGISDVEQIVADALWVNGLDETVWSDKSQRQVRARLVRALVLQGGLSQRQIADSTGVCRETIRRIMLSEEPSP